ncbi:MAG: glycosyltransferase family 4 protein [Chloroflexi bacterium]|nr:glycosyltransferase family 4 protein [Chloroflexota bacterium]
MDMVPVVGQPLRTPARVLLVDHADFLGGAERSLIELARYVDPAQYEMIFACPPGALMTEAMRNNIHTAPLGLGQMRGRRNALSAPFRLARGVRNLRRLILSEHAVIVHSNTMRAALYAAPAARSTGARLVWHVRDLHRERAYLEIMSRLADAIIVNAHAVARTIPTRAQHKTQVIHNGVPLRAFDPSAWSGSAFREELGFAPDACVIGNVGWLAPWKGQREFIEAASLVVKTCPQARFVIIGAVSDPRYAEYERTMRALGRELLGDQLVWAGNRQPIQAALAALDLVLHCSENEPFGRVIIEAMAMRIPVVAFRGGGVEEIVADSETGSLADPHDVRGVAELVSALIADPQRRHAMGAAAHARVSALFDAETTARQVEQVYASLLAARA